MTKDEQRAAAKELFMTGWDQQRIAKALDISQTTMTKWAKDGNWREERARRYTMDETRADKILNLIDYQIEVLESIAKDNKQANADFQELVKSGVELSPEDIHKGRLKLLGKGEIDALSKLFSTIKGKDLSWTQYITVTKELIEFLSERDNDLAKALVEYTDAFLLHKRDLIVA